MVGTSTFTRARLLKRVCIDLPNRATINRATFERRQKPLDAHLRADHQVRHLLLEPSWEPGPVDDVGLANPKSDRRELDERRA